MSRANLHPNPLSGFSEDYPDPAEHDEPWSDLEDVLADVISDSMDMDWTSRDGARAVVDYLKKIGVRI